MKKLADEKILKGKTETISAMDFRKSPGEVLLQVEMGKIYIITRNGKPVAEIRSPEPSAVELGAAVRKMGLAGK